MNLEVPRLRIFAGPNGSRKSTIKGVIKKELLGVYINPDEIEKEIKVYDFLDLDNYKVKATKKEIMTFFENSTLLKNANLDDEVVFLKFNDNKLIFSDLSVNSYFASVCADFIRKKLCEQRESFTFETVMSSKDKIELLKLAKKLGYKVYLYFVATNDPLINISRVKNRVQKGGHFVPEDKIVSRYYRTLENLKEAVKYTDRAYMFDNSTHSYTWICEITNAKNVQMKKDAIPQWLNKYLFDIETD